MKLRPILTALATFVLAIPSVLCENRVETRASLSSGSGLYASTEVDLGKESRLAFTLGGSLESDHELMGAEVSGGMRYRLGTKEMPWGLGLHASSGGGVHSDDSSIAAFAGVALALEAWHHWVPASRTRVVSRLFHGPASATVVGAGPGGLVGEWVNAPASTLLDVSVRYSLPSGLFGTLGFDAPIGDRSPSRMSFGVGTAF